MYSHAPGRPSSLRAFKVLDPPLVYLGQLQLASRAPIVGRSRVRHMAAAHAVRIQTFATVLEGAVVEHQTEHSMSARGVPDIASDWQPSTGERASKVDQNENRPGELPARQGRILRLRDFLAITVVYKGRFDLWLANP
jgi:hypothetical protein